MFKNFKKSMYSNNFYLIKILESNEEKTFFCVQGKLGYLGVIVYKYDSTSLLLGGSYQRWYLEELKNHTKVLVSKEQFTCWVLSMSKLKQIKKFPSYASYINSDNAFWSIEQFQRFLSTSQSRSSEGFSVRLELVGIGYKVEFLEKNNSLKFSLGFRHSVLVNVPANLKVYLQPNRKNQVLSLFGLQKGDVIQFGSQIRKLLPPEPYKGKGIRFSHEKIKLKEGKKNQF